MTLVALNRFVQHGSGTSSRSGSKSWRRFQRSIELKLPLAEKEIAVAHLPVPRATERLALSRAAGRSSASTRPSLSKPS